MSNTVSWPELSFTLMALVGLAINWWGFNDAVKDLHFLQSKTADDFPNATDDDMAAWEDGGMGSCQEEAIRAVIQFLFLALGLYLMTKAPSNPQAATTQQGIVFSVVIITVELLLIAKSMLARRRRHRIIARLSGGKRLT